MGTVSCAGRDISDCVYDHDLVRVDWSQKSVKDISESYMRFAIRKYRDNKPDRVARESGD